MAFFVIGGKPTCTTFLHITHIAYHLQSKLPNFKVLVVEKPTGEFEPWLDGLNKKNRWHHVRSPIIWKELSMRGGVPHYLGGAGEFWEYCYHYYGLQSIETPENLNQILEDHLEYYRQCEKMGESAFTRKIGIIQTRNHILDFLLSQLVQMPLLFDKGSLEIRLYDIMSDHAAAKNAVDEILPDLETLAFKSSTGMLEAVEKVQDAIIGCELLLILGDLSRKQEEDEADWLLRNMSNMHLIADAVNGCANRNLKIIVATDGPVCFNATMLIGSCTSIRITNIVALTSDIGLGALRSAADFANVPLSNISGPPIWGYVGINDFVDLKSAVIYGEIYFPNHRALTNKGGSTLPLGDVHSELRFLCYLIDNVDTICAAADKRREKIKKCLNRNACYSKVQSLICLIEQWYSKEETENIISLGICSDGSFGIPSGLVFSQPAILENNTWKPYKDFPTMNETQKIIQNLVDDTQRANDLAFFGSVCGSDNSLCFCQGRRSVN